MAIRKCNRWSLEGVVSCSRRGCSACQSGLLSFITIITSLRWRLDLRTETLLVAEEDPQSPRGELEIWRERAAMLARNIEEAQGGRRQSWRRRRAARAFQLRQLHWARVSKITSEGAFVRINGLEWPVYVPEVAWGDVRSVAELVTVGQLVSVKTLSNETFKKHPFLLLQI